MDGITICNFRNIICDFSQKSTWCLVFGVWCLRERDDLGKGAFVRCVPMTLFWSFCLLIKWSRIENNTIGRTMTLMFNEISFSSSKYSPVFDMLMMMFKRKFIKATRSTVYTFYIWYIAGVSAVLCLIDQLQRKKRKSKILFECGFEDRVCWSVDGFIQDTIHHR